MPPVKKRPRVEADYSWVGTSVQNSSDIREEHCFRAAGLHSCTPCPLILDIDSRVEGDGHRASTVRSSSVGSSCSFEIVDGPGAASATSDRSSSHPPAAAEAGNGIAVPSIGMTNGEKKQAQERDKHDQRGRIKSKPKQTEKAKRQQALAKIGCSAQACRNNPQCYNHIGINVACSEQPKEVALAELGDGPGMREDGMPIGLRNLGATCYANAFLQVWYHNVQFRNELYRCHLTDRSKLSHLVTVFACLQKYNGDVADPLALVEALGLKHGEQQDAGEFSKLFMDLIRRDLEKQPDPAARNLMSHLFEGKLQYKTKCLGCMHASVRDESFLELELSLKDGDTLVERIKALMSPELLSGDNQYHCSNCDRKCDAERSVAVSEVPEVIHFSLLRFIFDVKSFTRKKSKAAILYPKTTMFGGVQYDLRAVVTHLGTSPHHGHFVCDVMDQTTQEWIHCSDADISPMPEVKRTSKSREGHESSRDAYMLVYARRHEQVIAPIDPPKDVLMAVDAANTALKVSWEEWRDRCEAKSKEYDELRELKEQVARVLPGNDCIVPRDALTDWLKANRSDLDKPLSYESVGCEHSTDEEPQIDPEKGRATKFISQAAFDTIAQRTPIKAASVCRTCVTDKFAQHMAAQDRVDQAHTFDELNVGDRVIVMPQEWLDEWKTGGLESGCLPTSNGYSLYCAHEEPYIGDRMSTTITAEALALLQSAVGDFDTFTHDARACVKCTASDQAIGDMRATWSSAVKAERKLASSMDARPIMYDTDYYAVSSQWYDEWSEYRKSPMARPTYTADLCEHALLPVDPTVERLHHLTKEGWALLEQFYGPQQPVIVRYSGNPLPGALTDVTTFRPAVCTDCCKARALQWVETTVHVQQSIKRTTGTRGRSKDITIMVTKETTVKDLRVEILNVTRISPMSQELMYEGRKLDEAGATMHDVGMTRNGRIALREIIELDDLDEAGQGREGFHGTALMGGYAGGNDSSMNGDGSENTHEEGNGTTGTHDPDDEDTNEITKTNANVETKQATSANGKTANTCSPHGAAEAAARMAADEAFARQLAAQTGGEDADELAMDTGSLQVSCTACTFLNPAMATQCEMCGCEV